MKTLLVATITCFLLFPNAYAQRVATYVKHGTTYVYGAYYQTTGKPMVKRSAKSRRVFLQTLGYTKTPSGYEVDHIIPLSEGGLDTPSNMQLLTVEEHQKKTISERKANSKTRKL